jgi:hypothetical protein
MTHIHHFANIPEEMLNYVQWVTWRLEDVDGNVTRYSAPTKIPYDPKTHQMASVSDPSTWTTFERAVSALQENSYNGLGFVFTQRDPYSGIDLDDVSKKLEAKAISQIECDLYWQQQQKIYEEFASYTERSPSGKGLHIIVRGKVPTGRRRNSIELYSDKRYFTMTGDVYGGRKIIEPYQDLLTQLWRQMGKGVAAEAYDGNVPEKEPDEKIIERASNADNRIKFNVLFKGDWRTIYQSQSEADFAFIDIIAFYTQNRAQIERIFRASQLGQRKKAQRGDYVTWMVNKSFDNQLPPIDMEGLNNQLQLQLTEQEKENGQVAQAVPSSSSSVEGIPNEEEPLLPDIEEPVNRHLDLPKGLVGDIAKFIFESSVRPLQEVSLCAAIGLMAGICGRVYNIGGAGLNFYTLLLAQTGVGKEAISAGISKLIFHLEPNVPNIRKFIGPTFRSDASIVKWLSANPSVLTVMNEFGLTLCQMSSAKNQMGAQAFLKEALLKLYPKSGQFDTYDPLAYSDKVKNTDVIRSPSLSIIGESVPEEFYKHMDETVISGGLLPRFMIIEVPPGVRPKLNENAHLIKPEIDLLTKLGSLAAMCITLNTHEPRRVVDVQMEPEANKLLKDFNMYVDEQMVHAGHQDMIRQLWNRAHLKALKLASLLAVGCDKDFPIINLEQANWAKNLVLRDVKNILGRAYRGEFGSGASETTEAKQFQSMKDYIADYFLLPVSQVVRYDKLAEEFRKAGLVSYAYLQRRGVSQTVFRNDRLNGTNAIKRTLQVMIDSGLLEQVSDKQMTDKFGKKPKCFMVVDTEIIRKHKKILGKK